MAARALHITIERSDWRVSGSTCRAACGLETSDHYHALKLLLVAHNEVLHQQPHSVNGSSVAVHQQPYIVNGSSVMTPPSAYLQQGETTPMPLRPA